MSPFDPKYPRKQAETSEVRVIVRDPRPEEGEVGEVDLLLEERGPRWVVAPPPEAEQEREALLASLLEKHGAFILQMLLARGDLLEESAKDLRQQVLLRLCAEVDQGTEFENVRGFLVWLIRGEVSNHKKQRKPLLDRGAEVEDAVCEAPDPEQELALAEQRKRLSRYLGSLSPEEAEVIRCTGMGMTLAQTASSMGRPVGTVTTLLGRAKEKLREMALESDREVALGKRRPRSLTERA